MIRKVLFRRRSKPRSESALLLDPEIMRKLHHLEIRTRGFVESLYSGEHASVFHGRGMDFSHVRGYQPGDDVRAIDWKVTARRNEAFVRQFVEERDLPVVLLMDLSASARFGPGPRSSAQVGAEVAAALAFAADSMNDRTALVLATDRVEAFQAPGSGRKHTLRLLTKLLSIEPKGRRTDLVPALEQIAHSISGRATIFAIGDFIQDPGAPGFRDALGRVARAHDLIGVRLASGAADLLPNVGWLEVLDPESGRRTLINSASHRVRDRYRRAIEESRAGITRLFAEVGAELIELDSHSDPLAELTRFFRQRSARS